MASNGYPHMVFVQPDAGLDKESLAVFLEGLFPDAEVTDKPLRVDVELGGYVFSLWLEEADGVADHYATYLPEGARRRWLSRCESMIDLHGQPDPERVHAAHAERIVSALQAQDGIEVFSEETRRFVGWDYPDAATGEPSSQSDARLGAGSAGAPTVAAAGAAVPDEPQVTSVASPYDGVLPQPVSEPPVEPAPASRPDPAGDEPTTVWMPATPEPDSGWQDSPAAEAERAAVGHAIAPESAEPTPAPAAYEAPAPAAYETPAPAAYETPAPAAASAAPEPPTWAPHAWPQAPESPESAEEKKGFFRRVFGRKAE